MDKIAWCMSKKDGISFVEPNQNLADGYIQKAEGSLKSMRENSGIDWKISTAYYAMYFSLYSILIRAGIKCEIHSCTLEFAKRFLNEYFSEEECELLTDSFSARIDAQYYVNKEVPDELYNKMISTAPEFLVKCKNVLAQLTEEKINEIRTMLRNAVNY